MAAGRRLMVISLVMGQALARRVHRGDGDGGAQASGTLPFGARLNVRLRQSDYSSRTRAQFVIELKSGWLDELELQVEDKIAPDLPRLKARAKRTDAR